MKFIVWVKEKLGSDWEEQGDGPLTKSEAERIAKEIRHLCRAVKVLPVGALPWDRVH